MKTHITSTFRRFAVAGRAAAPASLAGLVTTTFLVITAVLVGTGCETRGSKFGTSSDAVGAGDVAMASDSAAGNGDATASDSGPAQDTSFDPNAWVFTEYPNEWIEAPAGYCDDVAHQTISQYVFDGDTIEVTSGGKVRLLGINSTELSTSECYSTEGADAMRALLARDKTVCLYADPKGDASDMYGRLLRYVYVHHEGKWLMINHRQVRLGVAKAYHYFLKNRTYEKQILQAELDARDAKDGGWGACGWVIEQ